RTMCKWWCSCFPCCPCPGSTFSGSCATCQTPTGAATRKERHKIENASTQMPVARLGDTIYSLPSDQAPYHFISYAWKRRHSFPRHDSILDKHCVFRLKSNRL